MKLRYVLKQLLRQGLLRLLLLMAVTGYCGYMLALQVLPLQQIDVAASLWDKPSMADCVLANYDGKAPATSFGYNLHWLETLEELQNLPEVRALYTAESFVAASLSEQDLILQGHGISPEWLKKAQLSLSAGRVEEYRPEAGYVPAVVSASLRGRFHIGDEIELRFMADYPLKAEGEIGEFQDLRIKVTGFLPVSDAYPNFSSGLSVAEPDVYSVMTDWYGLNPENYHMLVSQEVLADSPIYRYSTTYFMAFQLEEAVAKDPAATQRFIQLLASRGIATAATGKQMGDTIRGSMSSHRTTVLAVTMIVLFLVLALFSVVTFQTAFIYERKKSLAVLHLMGMTWRLIGAGWLALCTVCGVLPSLVGMCIGTWERTYGVTFWPTTPYLYLMPLGMLIVFGVTIVFGLRGFSRTDAALLLHED